MSCTLLKEGKCLLRLHWKCFHTIHLLVFVTFVFVTHFENLRSIKIVVLIHILDLLLTKRMFLELNYTIVHIILILFTLKSLLMKSYGICLHILVRNGLLFSNGISYCPPIYQEVWLDVLNLDYIANGLALNQIKGNTCACLRYLFVTNVGSSSKPWWYPTLVWPWDLVISW